jgi:hypothetical protein
MKNLNNKNAITLAILAGLIITTTSFARRYETRRYYRSTPIVITSSYRQPISYYNTYCEPAEYAYYDDSYRCDDEKRWVKVAKVCTAMICDAITENRRPATVIYTQPKPRSRSTIIFTPQNRQRHSSIFQNDRPRRNRSYNDNKRFDNRQNRQNRQNRRNRRNNQREHRRR